MHRDNIVINKHFSHFNKKIKKCFQKNENDPKQFDNILNRINKAEYD